MPRTSLKTIILYSVVLRLVFGSLLYHPDLKSQYFHGQFLSTGITNIYQYLTLNRFSLGYSDTFNYPPLTYLFFGSWYPVTKVLSGPGLGMWLNDWGAKSLFHPGLFTYLLVLKLPYLFADLALLWFLLRLFPLHPRRTALIWLFNPVSLYAVYAVGQFDILPALATVAAVYFARKNRFSSAALLLSLGACLKSYPLLLLPFLVLAAPKFSSKIMAGLLGLLPWIVLFKLFPGSGAVLQSGLSARLLTQYLYMVSGSQGVLIYPFVYILSLWLFFYSRTKNLLWPFLVVTLSVILFSDYHLQWAMWSLPFLVLFSLRSRKFLLAAGIFILLLFINLLFLPDQYAYIGLLSPINPYLASVPSLPSLLPRIFTPDLHQLVKSILVLTGLYLLIKSYAIANPKTS